MPAVGFAMGDVTLVDLLESKSLVPEYIQSPEFIVIIGGEDERAIALADAAQLRAVGYRIEVHSKTKVSLSSLNRPTNLCPLRSDLR